MPNTSQTFLKAFRFNAEATLEELKASLSQKTKKEWISGSKEYFGDYIALNNRETGSVIRIFEEEGGYAFDFLNKTGSPREACEAEMQAFIHILTENSATDFTPTEDFY